MTDDRGPIGRLWDEAFAEPGKSVPVGDIVVCDFCDHDFTHRPDQGGMIFQSKAVCPQCTALMASDVKQYGEERYIRAGCPEGQSFADFVRAYRGPAAAIKVSC